MKIIEKMIDYIIKGLKQHPTIITDKYKLSLLKENVDTAGKHYMIGITTEYKCYDEGDEDEKVE